MDAISAFGKEAVSELLVACAQRSSPNDSLFHTLCKMPKLLDDLFSIDEDDDRLGYDVAKDHEIPATEAWNR